MIMYLLLINLDYVAYRDGNSGSIFMRALVTTFYRLAGKKHVEELSKPVSFCVSKAERSNLTYQFTARSREGWPTS